MIKLLELSPVLTVFPYALLYYALLLASCGLAYAALVRAGKSGNQLRISLVVIFLAQLFLLTANLFSYQGVQFMTAVFPILHRGLNLVCLIWLIWALFAGREESLPGWLPIALTAAVLIVSALTALWWFPQSAQANFNFSLWDYLWIGLTLVLIFSAGIAYLLRYRRRVIEPLLILGLAAAGFVFYLVLPEAGNLPALVMLSQLLYYPIFISLAYQETKADQPDKAVYGPEAEKTPLRANIANTFLEVSLQSTRDSLEKKLAHGLGLYLMADLLGFLSYQEGASALKLTNTYDLIREDHLGKVGLPIGQFPSLLEALENQRLLLSNKSSQLKAEKEALMPLSGYNRVGNLMLFPLSSGDPAVKRAVFALSPYTGKVWGPEEISRLEQLKENISRLLEKALKLEEDARRLNDIQEELLEKTQQIQVMNRNYDQSQTDLAKANQDLAQTQDAWTQEVELWIDRQKALEGDLETLRQTIEANRENVEQADRLRQQKQQLEETIRQNALQADELRGALEQASSLLSKLRFSSAESLPLPPGEDNPEPRQTIENQESDA